MARFNLEHLKNSFKPDIYYNFNKVYRLFLNVGMKLFFIFKNCTVNLR